MSNDQIDPELDAQLLALPTLERVRLLHLLILSLEEKYDADAEALWFAEIERQAKLAEEDPDEPTPWADAKEILGIRMQRLLPAGPYARTLALAGTGHTDYPDVSSDKYKHLAEIYGDNHEDE